MNTSDGSQYHILDVTAIKTANVSSSSTRSLLSQNKTRAEIATDIRNYIQNAPTTAKGDFRFAGQAYSVDIAGYANYSTFTPTTVGNISLSAVAPPKKMNIKNCKER